VRQDRLGCYGYGPPTSPALDRFAARALRFTNAFSPLPSTPKAHMSMLTGLYPTAHGLENDRALPAEVRTLAELLRARGYRTMAVVDKVPFLNPRLGFGRGFDYYQQVPDDAAMKRHRILQLLDDAGDEPHFLFLHFYDAHSDRRRLPYEAAPEDLDAFAGRFDARHEWRDEEGNRASAYLLELAARGALLEGETRAHLESLYDAGLRTLDRELELLFDGFEQRGWFERSVFLITSDHGEEFFEHGQPLHRQCYDECVAVPFLLRTPEGVGGTSDELVSLVDVTPTFLELAGAPLPELQGVSLVPLLAGGPLARERDVVLLDEGDGFLGLRARDWSLVPSRGPSWLFDLAADPGQTADLLQGPRDPTHLPDVDALLEREGARLRALRARFASRQEEVETTGAEAEALRALGYAGDG
jgi:arylsulfatase A-like enzyme